MIFLPCEDFLERIIDPRFVLVFFCDTSQKLTVVNFWPRISMNAEYTRNFVELIRTHMKVIKGSNFSSYLKMNQNYTVCIKCVIIIQYAGYNIRVMNCHKSNIRTCLFFPYFLASSLYCFISSQYTIIYLKADLDHLCLTCHVVVNL